MPLNPTAQLIARLGGTSPPQLGVVADQIASTCDVAVLTTQYDPNTGWINLADIAPRSGTTDASGKDEGPPTLPIVTIVVPRGATKAAVQAALATASTAAGSASVLT